MFKKNMMMKIIFYLLILLITIYSGYSQSWIGYTVVSGTPVRDAHFTSSTAGICVGPANTIYRSTNGGGAWNSVPSNNNGLLYSIWFTNQNTAYVTGELGDMVKTTNGGLSWQSSDVTSGGSLFDVVFINETTGLACGYGIYKTTNSGVNWSQITNGLTGTLYSIDFAPNNPSILYCCGSNGIIAKSIDYGNSWVQIPINVNVDYDCIDAFAPGEVIVMGAGVIRRTTNGGENWTLIQHSPSTYFTDVQMVNASTGFACGFGGNEGRVFKTYNGGANWYQLTYSAPQNLNGLYFINETTGFFARHDGDIIKTTNGGGSPIGINTVSTEIPTEYSLDQNYPNPFNPNTNIKFSTPKEGQVTLKLYDITGCEIAELINQNLQAGTYSYDFNAPYLSSGVYYYRMTANGFNTVRKMVLIK